MDTKGRQVRHHRQESVLATSAVLTRYEPASSEPNDGLDPSLLKLPLTDQQAAFCEHYARDMNGARAYAAGYPKARDLRPTIRSEHARRLLRTPKILARIADLRGESRSEWCSRAKLPSPKTISAAPRTMPAPAQIVPTVEHLALLAFDKSQPDIVRLAALRRLDEGLAALASQASTVGAPVIRVAITVEARRPPDDHPRAAVDSFVAMFVGSRRERGAIDDTS